MQNTGLRGAVRERQERRAMRQTRWKRQRARRDARVGSSCRCARTSGEVFVVRKDEDGWWTHTGGSWDVEEVSE
uniref:Uncharacterized protein n=1 Tax=Knipowitschia caucasica TaxID=637954 RepID=A0AAV2M562_KNICA